MTLRNGWKTTTALPTCCLHLKVKQFVIFLACFSILLLSNTGCTDTGTSVAEFNKTNIKRLRNAYALYQTGHGGKGPKSEEDLKNYLTSDKAASIRLERMGVASESLDDIFASERDGQPFTVRYGVSNTRDEAIVFEQTGVDGKRMVAFHEPRELDDQEYQSYLSGDEKGEELDDGVPE